MTLSKDDADGLLSAVDGGDPAGEQAAMLFSINESFARLFSASLTTLLRGLVEMELKSVEQPARAMAPRSTPSRRPRPPARGRSSS
jgi:Flagellar motor switch protein FliM